jgi:hypothetical protein
MIWLVIINLTGIIVLTILLWLLHLRNEELSDRVSLIESNINTLQENEKVLLSMLKKTKYDLKKEQKK